MSKQRTALTIAGSDPSGGAGLQADLKVFQQYGVYGMSVVTLLTVQNTCGVDRVSVLDSGLVIEQLNSVVSDMPVHAAKTGALGSRENIEALAKNLEGMDFPLVIDPVMVSTHGAVLLERDARFALLDKLAPLSVLLTPNIREAELLSGKQIQAFDDMIVAAETIKRSGIANVLVKGGHLGNESDDLLMLGKNPIRLTAKRVDTRHTHGTGCTLAAAIAAGLSLGDSLENAVKSAKDFVTQGISTNPGLGRGQGPLNFFVTPIRGNTD